MAAGVAAAVLAVGCSSGASPADPPGAESCQASAGAARTRIAAVVASNQACASDAECSVVPVRASCFDACLRAVNETGRGAVDRASTLVEASECKAFHHAGCKLDAPACAPPAEPRCEAGRCR
jgi:hypothetical protein